MGSDQVCKEETKFERELSRYSSSLTSLKSIHDRVLNLKNQLLSDNKLVSTNSEDKEEKVSYVDGSRLGKLDQYNTDFDKILSDIFDTINKLEDIV